MMIVVGILFGMAVGFNLGIWSGKVMMERLYKPLIDSYKRDEKYWFDSYMALLKDYREMSAMYVKEATKNIFK